MATTALRCIDFLALGFEHSILENRIAWSVTWQVGQTLSESMMRVPQLEGGRKESTSEDRPADCSWPEDKNNKINIKKYFWVDAFGFQNKPHKQCILSQISYICFSPKKILHPGGIRTRIFCFSTVCDAHCAMTPGPVKYIFIAIFIRTFKHIRSVTRFRVFLPYGGNFVTK
jgi:hypothetical protein